MVKMTGKNSISTKQYNRGLILQLIATGTCNTRIELSKMTQLAKMTVTNIISEFIEQDIVVECEEELIQNSYEVIDRLLEKEKNILGIGVAVIGPVDIWNGIILNPPRFYGIQNVNILALLKARYPLPIYLDHDNNSAALAEKLFGMGKDVQDFIFLGVSNGIGSGIISDGKVFHNRRGLEPEIGHISIDCNGRICSCGNRGCVEMYASSNVVLKNLRNATGKNIDFADFCKLEGCIEADRIFENMICDISAALVSSINMLQPELIVLGHDCMDWDEKYVQMLENIVNEKKVVHDQRRIHVKKAFFGKKAQLIGAAANVVDQAFKGKLL